MSPKCTSCLCHKAEDRGIWGQEGHIGRRLTLEKILSVSASNKATNSQVPRTQGVQCELSSTPMTQEGGPVTAYR
jgi:hypothetical protein